jgi:hypothetical protein
MKVLNLFIIAVFFALITCGTQLFGQSASGIGLSYGPNRPFSGDYNWGSGWQLFGDIRIGKRFEIVPNIGLESLNSKGHVYQIDPYNTRKIENIDLLYAGVSGKYNFNNNFFGKIGPLLYVGVGGDDLATAGIGGTAAGGYNWDLDDHSTLELSLYTSAVYIDSVGNGTTPMVGFKVGYVFNFRGRK